MVGNFYLGITSRLPVIRPKESCRPAAGGSLAEERNWLLSLFSCLKTRLSRKAIFQQQVQNMLRIATIRSLLAHPLGTDLGGISNLKLKPQLDDQISNQRDCLLASMPTRTPAPRCFSSR